LLLVRCYFITTPWYVTTYQYLAPYLYWYAGKREDDEHSSAARVITFEPE
jgi:hypothetical protein